MNEEIRSTRLKSGLSILKNLRRENDREDHSSTSLRNPKSQVRAKRHLKAKSDVEWSWLSKNFGHFPVARSLGFKVEWCQLERRHHLSCALTTGVAILVPSEWKGWYPERVRLPDRFDLDLVLHLRAHVAVKRRRIIHHQAFKSGKVAIDRTHEKRVKGELDYKDYPKPGSESNLPSAFKKKKYELERAEEKAGRVAYSRGQKKLKRLSPQRGVTLEFRSIRSLLKAVGWRCNEVSNYDSIRERLEYLAGMIILFTRWRNVGSSELITKEIKFFKRVEFRNDGTVSIEFDRKFLKTTKGYARKIRLPLPLTSEAALNLHILALAWDSEKLRKGVVKNFHDFGEIIGLVDLPPWKVSMMFNRALDQVNRHRAKHGQGMQGMQLAIRVDPENQDNVILKSVG